MPNNKKSSPWSILFQPDAFNMSGERLMGRQAAGYSYVKGVASLGFDKISFYTKNLTDREKVTNLIQPLLTKKTDIQWVPWDEPHKSQEFGGIFFPEPKIGIQSLFRTKFGHNAYSLVGITHTTASDSVIDTVSDFLVKPLRPWDALICTSKSVKSTLDTIIENQKEFLKSEINANKFNDPLLPIIPLGINNDEFIYDDALREEGRSEMNINEDDIAIIFVGRLSFHAKSHHYPMFHSLNELAKEIGPDKKIHLILTGWFGNDNIKNVYIEEHRIIAPNVVLHIADGRNQDIKHKTIAASDIFLSLSDNVQETFGLTPLEAMSAGLPVIVSDWNGYRETVRDKKDGFMIPTKTLANGNGQDLIDNYRKGVYTYDYYIGYLSQIISVDIDLLISRLRDLILNKELRIKMGKSGQERARKEFSWSHILAQYSDLRNELDQIRNDSDQDKTMNYQNSANIDPFLLFDSYSTKVLKNNDKIKRHSYYQDSNLDKFLNFKSIEFIFSGDHRLFSKENINNVWKYITSDYRSITDIQNDTEIDISDILRIVMWLHKFGLIKVK